MSQEEHRESAVVIWRNLLGQSLWQLRSPEEGVRYASHWGLFGGGLEQHESPTMAILREIKEETGLSPSILWDIGKFTHPELSVIHCFLVEEDFKLDSLELGEGVDFGLFEDQQVLSGELYSNKLAASFPVVPPIVDLYRKVAANQFLRFGPTVIELED